MHADRGNAQGGSVVPPGGEVGPPNDEPGNPWGGNPWQGSWHGSSGQRRGWPMPPHAPWYFDPSHRPPPRMSPRARLWIPVVVSLLLQLPAALYWLGRGSQGIPGWTSVALAVVGPLVLLAAKRFPAAVIVIVTLLASADFLIADPTPSPPYVALAFAIVGAIVRGARVWAWVSVGIAWTATLITGAVLGLNGNPIRVAVSTLGILIVFGIGEAIRTRRELYAEYVRQREQRQQTEVQAERVRIARELHDVLAHSLSQINVQAGVGLHLMEKQPERAAEALASIKETSKTALDEVRSVLGVLRAEGGADPSAPLVPEPGLARLPGLAASVTAQGAEVDLAVRVDAATQAVELAVYRIVQESLTNVVRHAQARHATVTVERTGGDLVVTVADDGAGVASEASLDSGRGVLGMRERAELLGGTLTVEPGAARGLVVTARIPDPEAR